MRMRKLGRFEVSLVGLGCNNFGRRCDEEQTAAVVAAALENGVNFFDTADVYGDGLSEEYLGKALGPRRDEAVVATKFGAPFGEDPEQRGGSPRWIARAVEESLKRLSTDRIDLYQMHVPDSDVPIEDTLEALNALVEEGKVLEIGCSNFSGPQIDEAIDTSATRGFTTFVSAQNHYSLLNRDAEADVVPACERRGVGFLPYFPLANGFLTGKYRRGEKPPPETRLGQVPADRLERLLNEANFDLLERLERFASESGHTILELAISWLAARPEVASVIAGATRPEQVKANVAALSWDLSEGELEEIDAVATRAG